MSKHVNRRIIGSLILVSMMLVFSGEIFGGFLGLGSIPQPESENASAIAIKIPRVCPRLIVCQNQVVYFAKLGKSGDILSSEIYTSTYMKSDQYYLLNAKPGKYVAFAARYTYESGGAFSRQFTETGVFSTEQVKASMVEVIPGQLALMGDYEFSFYPPGSTFAPTGAQFLESADDTQKHYAKILLPDLEKHGITSALKFYPIKLNKANIDITAKEKQLESVKKQISSKGWESILTKTKPK